MSERDLIACVWDGEVFRPESEFMLRRASERFGTGEVIMLSAEEERSMRSHRHYFAQLTDLWRTLPERFALEPWAQSSEHLRRYLLIRSGFSDTTTYACASTAEASRLAAATKPMAARGIAVARRPQGLRATAKSQSVKAMGRADFQRSKDAVLGLAETLVAGGELPAVAA